MAADYQISTRNNANEVLSQTGQQWFTRSDNVDGPKSSETPPSKHSAANQSAGDVQQGARNEIDHGAHSRASSRDASQNLSPAKSVHIARDTATPNGALTSTTPYPREV